MELFKLIFKDKCIPPPTLKQNKSHWAYTTTRHASVYVDCCNFTTTKLEIQCGKFVIADDTVTALVNKKCLGFQERRLISWANIKLIDSHFTNIISCHNFLMKVLVHLWKVQITSSGKDMLKLFLSRISNDICSHCTYHSYTLVASNPEQMETYLILYPMIIFILKEIYL